MFSQALSKILITILALGVFHGAPVFAESKEEKKEEAGKAEGSAEDSPEANATESQKKQMSEATELQAKVQALKAKVKSKEETINKLIQEKNHIKDAEKVKEIIAEMVIEHKEMSKLIEEYEQNRSLLRYRYPEKGYSGDRSYERMAVKPLDQMESQMSVEAKLKRNLKTVHSQYGEPAETKKSKNIKARKKEAEAPSLTEPIVLQK
jgi:hypothetical protein